MTHYVRILPAALAWTVFCFTPMSLLGQDQADPFSTEAPPVIGTNLLQEIVPDSGPVRPPYDLARHDMGLTPLPGAPRTTETLRQAALQRQQQLCALWERTRPTIATTPQSPAPQVAEFRFLQYAFGEGSLEAALKAARAAGAEHRFRLARLLLAECRFDNAVRELADLADGKDSIAPLALALLARHAAERTAMAHRVMLVPLTLDLDAYLAKRSAEPATAALIQAIRQSSDIPLSQPTHAAGSTTVPWTEEEILMPGLPWDESVIPGNLVWEINEVMSWNESTLNEHPIIERTLSEAVLETESLDFLLYATQPLSSSNRTTLTLRSAYAGPIEFRLYRFEDQMSWDTARVETLAARQPERTWIREFHPLPANNTATNAWSDSVDVETPAEGYYLVTASARYAAPLAGQKFCVSHATFHLHVARNLAVVAALDRRSGTVIPGVPVKLEITGSPRLLMLAQRITNQVPDAFLAGLSNQTGKPFRPERDLAPSNMLTWAQSYNEGLKLRSRYPEIRRTLTGQTGPDGLATFPVDISGSDYCYTVQAIRQGPGFAETSLDYSESATPTNVKAVAWCDQPVYRPGDTAHMKGIVREFANWTIQPHTPERSRPVLIQIVDREGTQLWQGISDLSPAGTFSANVPIPLSATLGACSLKLDGERIQPTTFFNVQEFRLPSFSVNLNLNQQVLIAGETVTGRVEVGYYNGTPVAHAVVEVRLETGQPRPPSQVLLTDDKGIANVNLILPVREYDRDIVLRATVRDKSGQSRTVDQELRISRHALYLAATTSSYSVPNGAGVKITTRVTDYRMNPVPEATVLLEGSNLLARTDADGVAAFDILTPTNGTQQALSFVATHGTNMARSTLTVYLHPPTSSRGDQPAPGEFIRVNAHSIHAGDPLQVEVRLRNLSGQNETVLLALQNTRLLAFRTLSMPPGTNTITFPTDMEHAPYTHASAWSFNGHRWLTAQKTSVHVIPIQRFLTLTVTTDKTEYRPGERCVAELTARDHQDRPVPRAEISLGVIHAAVYGLFEDGTPDLREYFWDHQLPVWPRGSHIERVPSYLPTLGWQGPKYTWGSLAWAPDDLIHAISSPIAMKGVFGSRSPGARGYALGRYGGSGHTMSSRVWTRKNFRTCAFWVADAITDPAGRARVEFSFPDDITTWRFTARGVTADTRVGQVRHEARTMLPLQVELALPRALREGDSILAGAVIHNNQATHGQVAVSFSTDGSPCQAELAVTANGTARVDMPLKRTPAGTVVFRATVRDTQSTAADSIERTIAVLPRGYPDTRGISGPLHKGASIPLAFASGVMPGTLKATVNIEPGFQGVVDSALDELVGYPYGCVEQTMSRFMPAVVAARASKAMGRTSRHDAIIPDIFARGIARLAGFQHRDGGWGWWEKDDSNDFMTAYVLEGLALCRTGGHPVSESMMDRAGEYLATRFFASESDSAPVHAVGEVNVRVFTGHALATRYALDQTRFHDKTERLLAVLREPPKPPVTDRDAILLADAIRLAGDRDTARRQLREILARTAAAPVQADRQSIMVAASLLELGVALEPADPRWLALARHLVTIRKGAGWGDTITSACAVRGLTTMVTAAAGSVGPVSILVDNHVVGKLDLKKDMGATLALGPELAGARELRLQPQNRQSSGFWSVRLDATLAEPPATPLAPAATVNCRYFRVLPAREEVLPDAKGMLHVEAGTILEVNLECNLKQAMSYFRLSLPRPCGMELVAAPDLEKTKLTAFEERDDGLHVFGEAWAAGRHEVAFIVQAETAGEVFAPPPQLVPMYGDSVPVAVKAATIWNTRKAPEPGPEGSSSPDRNTNTPQKIIQAGARK